MKKLIFFVCLILFNSGSSHAARLFMFDSTDDDWDITVKTIKWIKGQPKELANENSYKIFKKNYYIKYYDHTDKRVVEEAKNIQYGYMDITNDGKAEIFVRETTSASGGYIIAVFENKNKTWNLIFDGRGGYIFERNENKKPFNLVFYERLGVDHIRYEFKYHANKYKLFKKTEINNNDLAFHDYFWDLNETEIEKCEKYSAYPKGSSENEYTKLNCKFDKKVR